MRNFVQLFAGIDTAPVLAALAAKPHLWNANPLRTTFPGSPHAETDDIWLWFNEIGEDETAAIDDIAVKPYPAWAELPQTHPLVFTLMHRVSGVQLGRVLITRLAPGKSIPEHADMGAPAEYYQRHQIVLQSQPGCVFNIGDETVAFQTGDAWWIDNSQPHSVVNNSADDRLVMIVDIRTC